MSYKEMDRTASIIASAMRNTACNVEEVFSILLSFCDELLPQLADKDCKEKYIDAKYTTTYYWEHLPEEKRHDYKKMYEYLFVEGCDNE